MKMKEIKRTNRDRRKLLNNSFFVKAMYSVILFIGIINKVSGQTPVNNISTMNPDPNTCMMPDCPITEVTQNIQYPAGASYPTYLIDTVDTIRSINCSNSYISNSTFLNNGQSQNATLSVALNNAVAGIVTFYISGSTDFSPANYGTYVNNGQSYVNIPVTFDGTATPGNYTLRYYASGYRDTCSLIVTIDSVDTPDMSPSLTILPSIANGTTNMTLTCKVWNVGSGATSGQIKVFVSKDDKVTLSWNGAATSIDGTTVHNSQWSLDATSNSSYYIFTTNSVINGGETNLNFGANLTFTPGNHSGYTAITVVILQATGETNVSNNVDAEGISYFAG